MEEPLRRLTEQREGGGTSGLGLVTGRPAPQLLGNPALIAQRANSAHGFCANMKLITQIQTRARTHVHTYTRTHALL